MKKIEIWNYFSDLEELIFERLLKLSFVKN